MMGTEIRITSAKCGTHPHSCTKSNNGHNQLAQGSISPISVIDMDPFSTTSSVTKPIPIPGQFTEEINAPIPREKMAFFLDLAQEKIFNDRTIPNGQKIQFASLFRPAWHAYTEEMIDGFIEGRISVKAFIAMLPPLKSCFFDVHTSPKECSIH